MTWIAPDDVLPRVLRIVARHATTRAKVCLVRDARGRVRIALEKDAVADSPRLAEELSREVGSWFAPPLLDQRGSPAHRRIAAELLRDPPAWPSGWPEDIELPDGSRAPVPGWLVGRAVLQSKESWIDAAAAPAADAPRVVSFYSFKGGVGRTTTLACVAARLARGERKVVAIDLDLEAPGVGQFLGARRDVGVVDHVLSHLATGDVGEVEPEPVAGHDGLWVVPAGVLGRGYIEKLARLDYLAVTAGEQTSPTEEALRSLLSAIADAVSPDVILLDSRAGLHDLGGLALHRLSHADILVSRANAQGRDGMRIVLETIRRLRPDAQDRDVRLVQTMVPMPFESPEATLLVERWRREMYDICLETIYEDLDDAPSLDQEVAHFPLLVGDRPEFTRTDRLAQVAPELLPHFDRIAEVVAPAGGDT